LSLAVSDGDFEITEIVETVFESHLKIFKNYPTTLLPLDLE